MDAIQIRLFLLGIGCYIVLRLLSPLIRKLPLAKTKISREYAFFILNLIIVFGGITISLYALKFTAAGDKMNDTQLNQISQWVNNYFTLIWVFSGIAAAAVLGWILEMIIILIRNKKHPPVVKENINVNISSTDMDIIRDKVESYEKVATLLQSFLSKIKGDNNDKKES